MRKISLLFICITYLLGVCTAQVTETARSITISISQLKSLGYAGAVNPDAQPIGDKNIALSFIKNISALNDPNLSLIRGDIDSYIRKLEDKENDKFAIVLLKHSLNLKKLFAEDLAKQGVFAGEYSTLNNRKTTLTSLISSIDEQTISIENSTRTVAGNPASAFNSVALTSAKVDELNKLKILRENSVAEVSTIDKKLAEIKASYIGVSSEIIEEEKVETMILDFNDEDWTDYLLNVDKVLYVIIGGPDDLQKGTLTIDNKPSSFQTELREALQVAGGLGIPMPVGPTIPGLTLKNNIKITFLLVKRKMIKAPSTLEYKWKDDKKVAVDIHEKARFGLKLGFSGAYVTRNNFTIDNQNQLTIQVDDAKKTELKSNLIALLEIIPWGRDIDRLEPIFAKNKDVKFFDLNRVSLVAGVRLSKDPLQSLYGGVGYLLSKTAALNFGISFTQTPKEVTDLPVGINASLDYLKDNADKELKPRIFFGISFSPLFLGKSLGIVK